MRADDWLSDIYTRQMDALCHYIQALQKSKGKRGKIDVQDCVHDVFLILWRKRESLYSHTNIDGWLRQTAKYVLWKKQAQADMDAANIAFHLDEILKDGMESLGSIIPTPDQSQDETNTQDQLDRIREIVGDEALAFLMEYYNKEISMDSMIEKYHITKSGIKLRVKRALDRIRDKTLFIFFIIKSL
jgi:RNA polymerase sigma factor (sigma-70 family)